jgi:hypothetical protein
LDTVPVDFFDVFATSFLLAVVAALDGLLTELFLDALAPALLEADRADEVEDFPTELVAELTTLLFFFLQPSWSPS